MRQQRLALLVAGVLVLAGCGSTAASPSGDDSAGPTPSTTTDVDAHPFTVDGVPAGWEPVIAGRGTREQDWGLDCCGTTEPYTVLEGPGGTTATVSVTGFADYQGGLHQAAAGYGRTAQETEVDGALAYVTPASAGQWADLVVERGDDLAVRASAPDASRDELVALERAAEPAADHAQAPSVSRPPPGWSVIGSVDADVLLALLSSVVPGSGVVPGPPTAYVAGWAAPAGSLSALTLPGDVVDLAALERTVPQIEGHAVDVGGRPGVVVVWRPAWVDSDLRQRAVVSHDESGAVTMVVAAPGAEPSEEDLVAMAATMAPADGATWDAFVAGQAGGPGVRPSDGATELARGTADGEEWLLQTHLADPAMVGNDLTDAELLEADPCLVLSGGRRVCADDNISGPVGSGRLYLRDAAAPDASEPEGFPVFLVVTTDAPGTAVRVTQHSGAVARGDLHPLPGVDRAGAVVFLDDPSPMYTCEPGPVPADRMRVEVADASDVVVACLGTP